jgi:hypothetical protein
LSGLPTGLTQLAFSERRQAARDGLAETFEINVNRMFDARSTS